MKKVVLILIPFLMVGIGCQKTFENASEAKLVADSDGNLFEISCLRENGKAIANYGKKAASSCIIGNIKTATKARAVYSDYTYYWWEWWYIYPPYYYSNNYRDFCMFIFGDYYYTDCFKDFFNYDSYWSYYYDPYCDYCLWARNPSRCYNRCWYRKGWYW